MLNIILVEHHNNIGNYAVKFIIQTTEQSGDFH